MLVKSSKELAGYIRQQRKQHNLSQSEVGESVGLKQATISDFENKPEGTKLDTLFRILAATNLEININPRGQARDLPKQQWSEEW